MQTLETMKSRSQAGLTSLVENAREQPPAIKKWGVTAGSAVVGAFALKAVSGGVVALLSTLTVPPVAMTLGAVGGGLLGWNYMRNQQMIPPPFTPPAPYEQTPVLVTPQGNEPPVAEPPVTQVTVVDLPAEPVASSPAEEVAALVEEVVESAEEVANHVAAPSDNQPKLG